MAGINDLPRTLIEPTTAAVNTPVFIKVTQSMTPATISATNLAGVEEVNIVFSTDNGLTSEAFFQSGVEGVLTLTNKVTSINSPQMIGVTKTATVGETRVTISYGETRV